ncbi:hypothetical protein LTR02_010859 [Friedmanniomyces endolithicus]|nr:hypothetical protein LTR02_010859 [Friedmanniomyces endolithicus]
MDTYGRTMEVQRSPPIRIASPARQSARDATMDEHMPIPKLDHEALREKAKKRKKNKKKGMPPAAPAMNIIKGFHTPVTSGGEESDISVVGTPMLGATGSPMMRPATPGTGGISALKSRLDALSLDDEQRRPSLARVLSTESYAYDSTTPASSRTSESDKTELETYDVALDQDFASESAGTRTPLFASQAVEGGLRTNTICRKMCADDFDPVRCLGKGAFGTVHLVKQQASGRLFAQKQFKKASLTVHKRLIEQTRTERTILESVNRHPFVVKLYYAFQDHEKLYLILEYAQGGELFHHLAMERMFSEEVAAFYMAEMVLALEHLHHNVRVIYRDLKPENCLLDAEGHLLLTDFGLSKVALEDERANSILGTIEYMAPEVIQGQGYDFAKLQLPYFLGPDAKDLLTRLLRKDPGKRLGGTNTKDLKTLKAHRFFRRIDWKKLERREVEPPIQPVITDPELAENFDNEFTDLAMSPVLSRDGQGFEDYMQDVVKAEVNPFGGFSYVASESLLESDGFELAA